MMNGSPESKPTAFEQSNLYNARVVQPLILVRIGHQLLHKSFIRVIEVIHGREFTVHGGADERDALAVSTEELETVVLRAESSGEGVVMEEGGGEGSGNNVEGIGGGRLGVVGGDIGPKVAETDTEIGIRVERRKRKDMVVGEGGARRKNRSGC